MLVLSRKNGEKLVIGDNITVEVVRIKGNRVVLGLVAPNDVRILRTELAKVETPKNHRIDMSESIAASELSIACPT